MEPFFVHVGKISYSWYLWHWPVFVFFKWSYGFSVLGEKVFALLISFHLATFTYNFVEMPTRKWTPKNGSYSDVYWRSFISVLCSSCFLGTLWSGALKGLFQLQFIQGQLQLGKVGVVLDHDHVPAPANGANTNAKGGGSCELEKAQAAVAATLKAKDDCRVEQYRWANAGGAIGEGGAMVAPGGAVAAPGGAEVAAPGGAGGSSKSKDSPIVSTVATTSQPWLRPVLGPPPTTDNTADSSSFDFRAEPEREPSSALFRDVPPQHAHADHGSARPVPAVASGPALPNLHGGQLFGNVPPVATSPFEILPIQTFPGKRIVFVGDSLTYYPYLNFVYQLTHGVPPPVDLYRSAQAQTWPLAEWGVLQDVLGVSAVPPPKPVGPLAPGAHFPAAERDRMYERALVKLLTTPQGDAADQNGGPEAETRAPTPKILAGNDSVSRTPRNRGGYPGSVSRSPRRFFQDKWGGIIPVNSISTTWILRWAYCDGDTVAQSFGGR